VKNTDEPEEQVTNELNEQQELLSELKSTPPENILSEEVVSHNEELITVISKISSHLISIRDIDRAINDALADLGRVTFASRAYLFLLSDDGSHFSNTHEWCAHGVVPQIHNLQNLPIAEFPWSMQKLMQKETIHVTDVNQMPDEANAERQSFEQQSIKSLLIFPVFIKEVFTGFIGFDNVEKKGTWSDSAVLLLRLFSEIIGSALERTQAETALRESEEKLRHMFQDVADAITVTDLKGYITDVNEKVLELHDYESKNDVLGKSAFELIAPSDHEEAAVKMQNIIKEGSIKDVEYTLLRKDGSEFPGELSASVLRDSSGSPVGFIAITRDITERRRIETELRRLATTDVLTDVYNRRSGLLLFKQQLQLARRNKQKLTVCYIDIDFLKTINDIYGHAEGDEVLKTTGAIIKQVLRKVDIICRLGGDEFLLIFPQCTVKQAVYIWNRIDEKIDSFNAKKTKPYSISLSRGFAEYDPVNDKSADQLITIADKEMYKHKHTKFQD